MTRTAAAALLLLAASSAAGAFEPEGREALAARCLTNPGTTAAFCRCLADRAVAELPAETRADLHAVWGHPSIFNFKAAMTARDLAEVDEQRWGAWQRKSVPACSAAR